MSVVVLVLLDDVKLACKMSTFYEWVTCNHWSQFYLPLNSFVLDPTEEDDTFVSIELHENVDEAVSVSLISHVTQYAGTFCAALYYASRVDFRVIITDQGSLFQNRIDQLYK